MKFNDFPYIRVKDDVLDTFERFEKDIRIAKSAEVILEVTKEVQKIYLSAATMYSLSMVRYSNDTRDEFYKKEKDFYDGFLPKLSEVYQRISLALLESPYKSELEKVWGERFFKQLEIDVKGISKDVLELMAEESVLSNTYDDINANAKIDWEGKIITLPELGKYQVDENEDVRKKAFEKSAEFYNKHIKEYDEIYDALVQNRTKQAKLLGYESYTELGYIRRGRQGYGPKEVSEFRKGIEKGVVPVVTEIKKDQAKRIGKDNITFINDKYLFPDGNPSPKGNAEHLWSQAVKMYSEMSKETKEFIEAMDYTGAYDLVSREGKRLGGFSTSFPDFEIPYIFSNFNETSGDVDVLTHEAGHAFNSYQNRKDIRYNALEYTYELAEVHSMAMEFFAEPWYELFFKEDTDKYILQHFEDNMSFLPYGCMVDEFQHFVYDNPSKTAKERNDFWLELESRYRPYLDFEDMPFYSEGRTWQRQAHIYSSPFYYIDYVLAQTVSFFLYMDMIEDKEKAWAKYMYFINNSNNEFFTELIDNTNISSPFKVKSLEELGEFSKKWLAKRK